MKTRGFTIIEAVLALSLLAVGLFGLLYSFQGSMTSSLLVEQSYVATNLARATMETIIARRDSSLSGGGYADTLSAIQAGSFNQSPVAGFTGYTVTATALEVDPGTSNDATNFTVAMANSGFARVTVAATFNGGTGTLNIVSLMANY